MNFRKQYEQLKELEGKATKGPWRDEHMGAGLVPSCRSIRSDHKVYAVADIHPQVENQPSCHADAALIVALRNKALPLIEALLERVEGLERALAWALPRA